MNNVKTLFTASLVLVSMTFASASNFFNSFRNVETNDIEGGIATPANRPSANHLEKNTNAKFIAKRLSKSVFANAILGKSSDVLERYGYRTSSNGAFSINSNVETAGSPIESFTIMSMSSNERGDVVRVRVESNKDLHVYLNTESGLEVPFELMNFGKNEIFISPLCALPKGSYIIRLKLKKGEKKLKLVV